MPDETYEGWSNRETWAVALHINNDQGWQNDVLNALREDVESHADDNYTQNEYDAGAIIRENVEEILTPSRDRAGNAVLAPFAWSALEDIGSLWRVNWTELGAAFLEDIEACQ